MQYTPCLKKRGVELFANVLRFFHRCKQLRIMYKISITFLISSRSRCIRRET